MNIILEVIVSTLYLLEYLVVLRQSNCSVLIGPQNQSFFEQSSLVCLKSQNIG